jgi:hypothetical protein
MVPEKRLDEHSPEELTETKAHALDELRKQLEQAQQELRYHKAKNQRAREDSAGLYYELHRHQRGLANDAGRSHTSTKPNGRN